MADDTDMQGQNLTDDSMDDSGLPDEDTELLNPERVVEEPGQNELVLAEIEAHDAERFDKSLEEETDPGIVNEENVPAELWEEGTGTNIKDEDIHDEMKMMHIEEFASDEEDSDSVDTLDNQME